MLTILIAVQCSSLEVSQKPHEELARWAVYSAAANLSQIKAISREMYVGGSERMSAYLLQRVGPVADA